MDKGSPLHTGFQDEKNPARKNHEPWSNSTGLSLNVAQAHELCGAKFGTFLFFQASPFMAGRRSAKNKTFLTSKPESICMSCLNIMQV